MYQYFINSNIQENSKLEPGSIISINGFLFYVSAIEHNSCLCYKLFCDNSNVHTSINIRNFCFGISFEQTKIDVNNDIKVILNLSEEEKNIIRNLKKEDKIKNKSNKSISKKIDYKSMYGKLLYLKRNRFIKYALYKINRVQNEYVNLNELARGNFVIEFFHPQEMFSTETSRVDFIRFINSLNVEIKDERYSEFLKRNYIYNQPNQNQGIQRKRKNHKNKQ